MSKTNLLLVVWNKSRSSRCSDILKASAPVSTIFWNINYIVQYPIWRTVKWAQSEGRSNGPNLKEDLMGPIWRKIEWHQSEGRLNGSNLTKNFNGLCWAQMNEPNSQNESPRMGPIEPRAQVNPLAASQPANQPAFQQTSQPSSKPGSRGISQQASQPIGL